MLGMHGPSRPWGHVKLDDAVCVVMTALQHGGKTKYRILLQIRFPGNRNTAAPHELQRQQPMQLRGKSPQDLVQT